MKYEVAESRDGNDEWIVTATDRESEGEMYCASFWGHGAKVRASEYSNWKMGVVLTPRNDSFVAQSGGYSTSAST